MTAELEPFDEQDVPVPVDPPARRVPIDAEVLSSRVVDKRPVIPPWMRDRAEFRALLAWLARYGAHEVGFHLPRIPTLYAARLAWRAPAGGWRVARLVFGWVFDAEAATVRHDAVRRNATTEYLSLSKQRNQRVRQRGATVLAGGLVLVVAVWVLLAWTVPCAEPVPGCTVPLVPTWVRIGCGVLVIAGLGVAGTSPDRRVLDVATVSPLAPPRLSADSVTRALRVLGISEMNKKDAAISYPAPITRDGPGWRADVDLPLGVTPQDVMEKRRELASGLRRPLGCVWPEPAREQHAGRLVLWVGDQDLAKARQPGWPLARTGSADLFGPVPFGTDQRGRPVCVTLMFANMIIGSIPRVGKTFALRLLLLGAALDVRAEIHAFDLKGMGDLSALEPIAHAYRCGDDPEDIEYLVEDMRALAAELRRRTKVVRNLPKDLCPENKITPELAGRRSLGLWPIVVGLDECFPAGTLVGGVPIQSLRPGDIVPSWDEDSVIPVSGVITAVFKNRPTALVRVNWAEGGALVCTPGHPIMTASGWKPAGTLTSTDKVLTYGQASATDDGSVLDLPATIRPRDISTGLLEEDWAGRLLRAMQESGLPVGSQVGAPHYGEGAECVVSAYEGEQPDAEPGDAGEGGRDAAGDGAQAGGAGRQRHWAHGAATPAGRGAGLGDGGRGVPGAGAGAWRAADSLQAGHRPPWPEGRGGDRRELPLRPVAPGGRPTEGRVAAWRGVDRVEVLQPGSDGRYGGLCPDGHVYNFEVAGTHTYLVADGVVAHNCQRGFEHPVHGKELTAIAEDLVRRGPAAGIIAIFATQRPDAKSLPTGISGNAILRFALKVLDHTANDMVLGTSAHKNGIKATIFTRRDLGIGWLSGEDDDPKITRTFYIDNPGAETIVTRARAMREKAGTLSGYCLGGDEQNLTAAVRLLDDLAVVFAQAEVVKLHTERILELLAALRPEVYGSWTPEALAAALRPEGVTPGQVWADGTNRKGYVLEHITAAMERRQIDR